MHEALNNMADMLTRCVCRQRGNTSTPASSLCKADETSKAARPSWSLPLSIAWLRPALVKHLCIANQPGIRHANPGCRDAEAAAERKREACRSSSTVAAPAGLLQFVQRMRPTCLLHKLGRQRIIACRTLQCNI